MIKTKFLNIFAVVLMLLQAVGPLPALAMASTNQPDYAPGAVVTISGDNSDGAGFAAAEAVHVAVSGPNSFAAACDATADDNGAWSCQVSLPADAADGNYAYTATGGTSGVSQSGSFTVTAPATPTVEPTQAPTEAPTVQPTQAPTEAPTLEPTAVPTEAPTTEPTQAPTTEPTQAPTATVAPVVLTPFIQSDLLDYAPGSLVTLTSGNWQPGESVHMIVNDTIGNSWVLSTDVVADNTGAFVYQFNLPNWFVAQYHVYSYGVMSGVATTDFTDSVTSVTITAPLHASPVTITSLPSTVTFSFNYVTSSTGSTTGQADVVGTTATNSKSLTPGTGSDNITVTIPVGTANGTYNAKVTVTNSTGTGSNNKNDSQNGAIIINVPTCTAPSVTTQPVSQTVTYGAASVNFTSAASGNPTPTVQWQVKIGAGSFTNLANVAPYSGVTTGTLTVTNPTVSLSTNQYRAVFTNTCGGTQTATSNAAILTVNKAMPVITWADPADIVYGTALSSTQLNATADVAGTFTYSPVAGTMLNAGNNQALSVGFVPTDSTNYSNASATVHINVLKAEQTITWNDPASIVYGTALGATQLNATVTVVGPAPAGALTYTPAAGTILNAGNGQALKVDVAETANYNAASKTVHIDVLKAEQTITWNDPASIVYGTALGATQLNATVSVGGPDMTTGALTYTPAAGTILNAGSAQALKVDVAETANYNAASKTVYLNVLKAEQAITWSNPADIVYGTALGATQLNATVGVVGPAPAGALTYTPAAGTILNAGSAQALKVDVAQTANYNAASKTVYLNVLKANQTITWSNPANIVYGTALGATQLNATVSVGGPDMTTGALTYTPAAGTILNPGNGQTLSVTAAATSNYNSASKTVAINVLYSTGLCLGSAGHTILQPINAGGDSVFKQGSTVPAKFRVCDANGNSIGTPGVVSSFRLIQTKTGTVVANVDEAVDSTTPDLAFRWSATDQQWIYNMNTKKLSANTTYYYDITLNDGSHILFQFGLK